MNFELFNDKSKILINDAQNKAISLNHQQVATDHLLVSILSENNNFIMQIFLELDLDYLKLKKQIESQLEDKPKILGENLKFFFLMILLKCLKNHKKLKMNLMMILYLRKFCYTHYYVVKE